MVHPPLPLPNGGGSEHSISVCARVLSQSVALYFMDFMLMCLIPMTHNHEGRAVFCHC